MTFSFYHVSLICLIYLGIVFGIAYATEKGWIPEKIVTHRLVYIFSLGIFASAWSFYGVIELAHRYGYGALAYYLGTGALFLFAPFTLKPLIELARRYQINSMADLLTFRYHSHSVGGIVTLCMLLAMIPLLALQIKAVGDTIYILTLFTSENVNKDHFAFGYREIFALAYCVVMAFFAMMFGSNREHHKGLITAMAFESLVKLTGLCAVGIFALYYVFSGFNDLDIWLRQNPAINEKLYASIDTHSFHTMLLVFLSTAVSMPHIFHMTVVENQVKEASRTVSWAFPLFLFFMALPIFPILWAGIKLDSQLPPEYFPLAVPIASGNATFTIISFVAGISAATGAVIAIALSVATMIMNHWILPATPLWTQKEIYGQLIRIRRILIAVVIAVGYAFYLSLGNRFNLTDLAITAFIATLQFLPGIIAVVYWSHGNRRGFVAGLFVGMSIWFSGIFIPILSGQHEYIISVFQYQLAVGIEHWADITLWSLALNAAVFIAVSHQTKQSDDERYSAALCSNDELSHPIRLSLDIRSPEEMVKRLSQRIGESTARIEIDKALLSLGLKPNESRPYALRRLRDEVEANLSGLLGISLASEIVDRQLPFNVPEKDASTDITLMETRISDMRDELTGVAGELNRLRLYHRRTFEELPMAACSVGKDEEIMLWNSAMEELTGIKDDGVTGSRLEEVLDPWGSLLKDFFSSEKAHFYKQEIEVTGKPHWISLHKAVIPSSFQMQNVESQVFLIEDVTEIQLLESELVHSERLASVGRLAAGVAHEIGNPVTGIACLAQNMKYETEEEEILEAADQILSQTDRVSRIVQSLMSFAHTGKSQDRVDDRVNLWECAQEAINLIGLQKEKGTVYYHNQIPESLHVMGDWQRIIQVFVNFLSNARDASPNESNITLEGRIEGKHVVFTVTDEGTGIPDDIKEQILEPFFTTKDPGEGTGLGLAMVYSIIDDHSGSIDIVSPVDISLQKGTKFVVKLPKPLESDAI